MALARRRLWIATALVAALLLVFGTLFQSSTRQALERAEAFRFRRMLVNRHAAEDAYRFFYVTNRAIEASQPELQDGTVPPFGRERQSALSFGRFDTEIETTLGIGMLIDPSDWFQNEEIQLRDVSQLEEAAFLAQLREQVEQAPGRSLLITVNGFRERFGSALRKTAFVSHVLDIDSPVLVFDWPGDQGSSVRGYRRAQSIAKASGAELARTLELVIREVKPDRLWLIANSMGGEVVVQALSELHSQDDFADAQAEIEDVILTAPDVDHAAFGERFDDEIADLVQDFTVYVSSNDRALLMSRILNRGRRLGESTVDPQNPDQSDEALAVYAMLDADDARVSLVDVTPVNRTRNFHNFSLETPEFFDDVFLRLVNPETPHSRLRYTVRTPDGRTYQVLTRGR